MCLGRVSRPSEANILWKELIQYYQKSAEYAEVSGIDGEAIEFEWNIFPRFTSIEILRHLQKDLDARQINPDHCEGRILFMSMFNDIDWTKNVKSDACMSNVREVSGYAKEFQRGHWSFLRPGDEETGTERATASQKETGTSKPIE